MRASHLTLVALASTTVGTGVLAGEPGKLRFGELPPNAGWLSDPNTPAEDAAHALVGGKIHLNNRARFEYGDQDTRKPSYAFTNRLRLGYETKPWEGFSALAEFENVSTFDTGLYNVPPSGDGDPTRVVIADPPGTEVNRAWLRYNAGDLLGEGTSLDIKGGRQRINFDDQRFFGAVAWRQFEQTFDAVRFDVSMDETKFTYIYNWRVQRIFGPDGPNWDTDNHIFKVDHTFEGGFKASAFVYLLDIQQSGINSSNTFGVRVQNATTLDEEAGRKLKYEATYAHQTDGRGNPMEYNADFFAIDVSASQKELGALGGGFQFLGSDGGNIAFRFPFGTNHKFNGFADLFLVTPNQGLQDLYIYAKGDLPWGIKGTVAYHEFWFDSGGSNIGHEIDAVLAKKLTPNWSILAKFATFDGDQGLRDTNRATFQTDFKF